MFGSGRSSFYTVLPGKLTSLFISGVAGQGFFGTRYHALWAALGTIVVIVIGVAWLLTAVMGLRREVAVASVAILYSLLYYATPVVLSGMTIGQPGGNRYLVGPLELLVFAVAVLLDAVLNRAARASWAAFGRPAAGVLCAGLLACAGYSAVTSYHAPDPARSKPTWSSALASARTRCDQGARHVVLPIAPISAKHHWHMLLSCALIEHG